MKLRPEEIRSQIQKAALKTIFFADDFGMENRQAVRVILSRLVKNGTIVRLGAGIYMKPRYSTLIHDVEYPLDQEIVAAIASMTGLTKYGREQA
jgi:predicted transcriptional regulator of viral defense system